MGLVNAHVCDDSCAHTFMICPKCGMGVRPSYHTERECAIYQVEQPKRLCGSAEPHLPHRVLVELDLSLYDCPGRPERVGASFIDTAGSEPTMNETLRVPRSERREPRR
jgi:hypothetical protein